MSSNAMSGAAGGAAMGAGIGSIVPGVGTAVGAVVGGGLGFMQGMGQDSQANAMNSMANAQLAQQQADRTAAMNLMAPTASEMQQLQQNMAVNQQGIQQAQGLLSATDPAIVEAANQARSLMAGGQAAGLSPMYNQRAQQRSQLQQQLQQQLGSGYATSSAGIQALNNFDQQTSNLTAQVQQNAIGQYMGYAQAGSALGSQRQQAGISNASALLGQQYGFQAGQANAIAGNPVNPGLAYTGQLQSANNTLGNIGMIWQGAGMYGMGQLGKGGGTNGATGATGGSAGMGSNGYGGATPNANYGSYA